MGSDHMPTAPAPNGETQPLQVLMLTSEYPPEALGGVATHVFDLATGLARAGNQVTVLTPTLGSSTRACDSNLTVERIAPSGARQALLQSSMIEQINGFNADLIAYGQRMIGGQGRQPDIIHCHDWTFFEAACRLGQQFGIPVVGTVHILHEPVAAGWGEAPNHEINHYERAFLHATDALITVSEATRSIIHAYYGLSCDKMHVVHNGLAVKSFVRPVPAAKLRQSFAPANEKIVLFAGRLHALKGIAAVFASAARVIAEYPQVRYLLVGDPGSREASDMFQQLSREYVDFRGKITSLGKVPRNQLAALYQITDIALIPSIYESFPYVALEAMAAGVPVVASDAGGLAEIIQHGETGLLVPIQKHIDRPHSVDIDQFTAAQLMLLNDEAMAKRLGELGKQRVLAEFDLETMVLSTWRVYQHILAA